MSKTTPRTVQFLVTPYRDIEKLTACTPYRLHLNSSRPRRPRPVTGRLVDASVAVKWSVTAASSEGSARLLDDEVTLIAPELLFAGVANAVWALCRLGDIGPGDFAEAVDTLRGGPIAVPSSMRQLAAAAGRLAVDVN